MTGRRSLGRVSTVGTALVFLVSAVAALAADRAEADRLYQQGKIDESIVAYEALSAESPWDPHPIVQLLHIYTNRSDWPAIERIRAKASGLQPKARAQVLKVFALVQLKGERWEEGRRTVELWSKVPERLEDDPFDALAASVHDRFDLFLPSFEKAMAERKVPKMQEQLLEWSAMLLPKGDRRAIAPRNVPENSLEAATKVEPKVPPDVREPGTVTLRLVVTSGGYVVWPEVVSSTNHALDEAAVRAVTRWRFRPVPKAVRTTVKLVFRPEEGSR